MKQKDSIENVPQQLESKNGNTVDKTVPDQQQQNQSQQQPQTNTKKYSVKFKRSRSTRACEVCHSRKVRCDAMIHIPCTNCLTFGCECKFPEPKIRKNAKKNKIIDNNGNNYNGKRESSTGENSRESITNNTTPSAAISSTSAIMTGGFPSNITTASSSIDQIPTSGTDSSTSTSKKKNEPVAAVSAQSAKIDQAKFSQKMASVSFIGTSSAANLLTDRSFTSSHRIIKDEFVPPYLKNIMDKTRIGLDTVQMEILRVRGAFLLPEKQLCDDLINTYFEKVYPSEPILLRETFMKDYRDGSVSILLLQAVLLAASRVSDHPSLFDSDGSNYLASCTFYQRAKALYDANYERDPLILVQSITLFTKFWEGLDDILGNSYYWTRIAITVAHGYGFHRSLNEAVLNDSEKKLWKILWWNLYIKDTSTSVAFGRPSAIHLVDCDVEMVKLDDFQNDVSKVDAEAFIQMVKLSEIVSIVLQEQYSAKAERSRHRENWVITHCDMLMSAWRNNLPQEIQYCPNKKFPLSVNSLNLYYYSAVCLVHRSNMVRTTTLHGKNYPSEGIVFQASRIIADIAAKMLRYNQIKYCNAQIIPTFFIASMTFICHLESQNKSIARTARLGYEVLFKALEEIGKTYLIAVVIGHNMKMLANDNKAREKLLSHLAKRNLNENIEPHQSPNVQINPNSFPVEPLKDTEAVVPTTSIQKEDPMPTLPEEGPHGPSYTIATEYNGSDSIHVRPSHQQQQQHIYQPQPQQPTQQQQQQSPVNNLEFPDLYLFTNTLPSSSWNNFDPAELFPTSKAQSPVPQQQQYLHHSHGAPSSANTTSSQTPMTSTTPSMPSKKDPNRTRASSSSNSMNRSPTELFDDVHVDGFDPSAFEINLAEFDFQNFNNSISLQNMASINDFFNPNQGGLDQSNTGSDTPSGY